MDERKGIFFYFDKDLHFFFLFEKIKMKKKKLKIKLYFFSLIYDIIVSLPEKFLFEHYDKE